MPGRIGGLVCLLLAMSGDARAQPAHAEAIDAAVSRLFALNAAPGLGVVVVRDTQVIYIKGFGMADAEARRPFTPETVFYIASTTKSFTGLAVAILDGQGRFLLDAPLSVYLPNIPLRPPLDADSITIRSLLAHTHGIGDGPIPTRLAFTGEYEGNAHLIALAAEHRPLPNRNYRYANLGYNLATVAMDTTLGEGWRDVLERLLFTPLGMQSTTAYLSRIAPERLAMPYLATLDGFERVRYAKSDVTMQSAGGLVTTLADMGRWLEAHLNGGRLDGRQILPEAAVAKAHLVSATMSGQARGLRQIGYGLGLQIALMGSDTLYTHGGGFPGFATHMSFMPGRLLGVAVFANTSNLGGVLADLVAQEIYHTLRGTPGLSADSLEWFRAQMGRQREALQADRARRAARPQTLPLPLAAYAGIYESRALGRLELLVTGGKLEARLGEAWSPVEAFDAANHQLRVELFGGGTVMPVHVTGSRADSLTLGNTVFRRQH